jgi:hypothetical protein
LDVIEHSVPGSVFRLLVWTLSCITYSKVLNPMIFMTKEYFVARVNGEEMWIVQHLVDLVEDWRYCKRLEVKRRCELARLAARKIE